MKKLSFIIVFCLGCSFLLAQKTMLPKSVPHPKDSVFYSASASASKISLMVTVDSATKWIEYHNTIANQPFNNYVFLKGSKKIGLYVVVPKGSVQYYRYSILENDHHWLVTDVKFNQVSARVINNLIEIDLGRFDIDNKN